MALAPVIAILFILGFAIASFFFAVAETALFSLGKWQAQRLAAKSAARGQAMAGLLKQPEDLLATIVLGNTLANAGMVVMGLWLIVQQDWPIVWTLAGILLLILVGCEVVPKTLAVRAPEPWALRMAQPMAWLKRCSLLARRLAQWLDTGLLRLLGAKPARPTAGLSDEEYQELLEMAYQQGALARSEKEFILQIISLDQRTAKEVMRPRSQMTCISDDLSVEEMIAASRQHRHRRLPIYDESTDTIVGVLNTRSLLLDPQIDLADAIEFPSFVPDSMNLLQLLKSLQQQQRGLAIVLDEFGGTAGLVTIEDILQEIIGEIRSESQEGGLVMEKLAAGRWRVSGTLRQEDFRREYPSLVEMPEVETMGGLMMNLLGIVPSPGQSVNAAGLRLTALAADERRVREILVEAVPKRGSP